MLIKAVFFRGGNPKLDLWSRIIWIFHDRKNKKSKNWLCNVKKKRWYANEAILTCSCLSACLTNSFQNISNKIIPELPMIRNRERNKTANGTSKFAWKTACQIKFFWIHSQKTAQITNLNLKSGLRFDLKNLTEVWIQRIHDLFLDFSEKKKNAKSVFGFKNPDSDFPPKTQPKTKSFKV